MKYDVIINHPHYEPKNHPRMPMAVRAAQFAPYAALSGHTNAIWRTARFAELRSRRVIEPNMDEDRYDLMNEIEDTNDGWVEDVSMDEMKDAEI